MKIKVIGSCCVVMAIVLIVIVVLVGRGISAMFLSKADMNVEPVHLEIVPGENVVTVARKLSDTGLLEASNWFKWYGRLSGSAGEIKAGEFDIYPGMDIVDLYAILSHSTTPEKTVTIIEGWTLDDISDMLENSGVGVDGELEDLVNNEEFRSEFAFLSEIPDGLDIEGYVFPETYRVFEDATAADIVRKSLATFEARVVNERSDKIASNDRSLFELITIASILEREVRSLEDKKMVADLIERRLDLGMPLQMDSTVNYVTGKNHPGILLKDRDVESPYNTYKYPGLPVGPISNPGIESIDAVLEPTPNDYLFFLTTPDGEVKYARTHTEHTQNKYLYLK